MNLSAQPHADRRALYKYYYFLYPWVYSSQGLKAKKLKSKPERRRSQKCRAEELS